MIGFGAWLLQRLTAALIIIFLTIHLRDQHFSGLGFQSFAYLALDGLLLALILFHALNGLRMIALDYTFFAEREKIVSRLLTAFGLITFILGFQALFPLLLGGK